MARESEEMGVTVAVAFHSAQGHTARVADAVARGAREGGAAQVWPISVEAMNDTKWKQLAAADAIVFGTPTLMGGPSAPFKAFADASASIWFQRGWSNKLAAGFTNSGSLSGDKLATLQYLAVFAAQHGMLWVGLDLLPGGNRAASTVDELNRLGSWLGMMAQSPVDAPLESAPPQSDLETAVLLGKRIATLARRWRVGQARVA